MGVGKRIGEECKRHGMNLRQLSINSRVPYSTLYSAVNRDSNGIDADTIRKVSNALGISASELYAESIAQQAAEALHDIDALPEITSECVQSIASNAVCSSEKKSKIKPVPLSTGESTSNEQLLLLQKYFLALNSTGREKALERLRELTEIPRYTSAPSDETTDTPTAPRSPAGNNSPSQD